jgi:peptide/nickel transport system permease protein
MANHIIRRLLQGFIVLILLSILVFILMRMMPGDPILLYMSRSQQGQATAEQIQALRHEYGLDKPILMQYFDWAGKAIHGNLGISIVKRTSVSSQISRALPITLYLGILAFILSIILGIPAGILAAVKRAKLLDYIITPLSILGVCVPIFWLAVMMAYVFGLELHWLPIFGFTSPFENLSLSLKQIAMPVICESLAAIAGCSRQTRSSMLEVIRQDYIRTAWSKGLSARVVVTRHALKNAIIPVVTLAGLQLGTIIGGSVLVETIFNIPGMGRLLVNSIFNQDYAVVQGVAIIFCAVLVVVNIIVDISYGWFDPRVRFA